MKTILLSLLLAGLLCLGACTTTTAPDGTVTKAPDGASIAAAAGLIGAGLEILREERAREERAEVEVEGGSK